VADRLLVAAAQGGQDQVGCVGGAEDRLVHPGFVDPDEAVANGVHRGVALGARLPDQLAGGPGVEVLGPEAELGDLGGEPAVGLAVAPDRVGADLLEAGPQVLALEEAHPGQELHDEGRHLPAVGLDVLLQGLRRAQRGRTRRLRVRELSHHAVVGAGHRFAGRDRRLFGGADPGRVEWYAVGLEPRVEGLVEGHQHDDRVGRHQAIGAVEAAQAPDLVPPPADRGVSPAHDLVTQREEIDRPGAGHGHHARRRTGRRSHAGDQLGIAVEKPDRVGEGQSP
jgi:hypothetical protein